MNYLFNILPFSSWWKTISTNYKEISQFLFRYPLYFRILWEKRINICPFIRDKLFPNKNCYLCIKMVKGLTFTFLLFLGYNLQIKYALDLVLIIFIYKIAKSAIVWLYEIWKSFYFIYCDNWKSRIGVFLITPAAIAINLLFVFLCSEILAFYSPHLRFLCFQYAILLRYVFSDIIHSNFCQKYIIEKIGNKVSKMKEIVSAIKEKKFFDSFF